MIQEDPGEVAATPKIPMSPCMPQPQKYKQAMWPVQVSPQNPRSSKLSMDEKGKAITLETKREEEYLQALITQIEAQDDEMENVSPVPLVIKLPP